MHAGSGTDPANVPAKRSARQRRVSRGNQIRNHSFASFRLCCGSQIRNHSFASFGLGCGSHIRNVGPRAGLWMESPGGIVARHIRTRTCRLVTGLGHRKSRGFESLRPDVRDVEAPALDSHPLAFVTQGTECLASNQVVGSSNLSEGSQSRSARPKSEDVSTATVGKSSDLRRAIEREDTGS